MLHYWSLPKFTNGVGEHTISSDWLCVRLQVSEKIRKSQKSVKKEHFFPGEIRMDYLWNKPFRVRICYKNRLTLATGFTI